ncbi:ferritin family protein [Novilysobacter antarcticus]|uniref:ferritin family protein n=1 Tax=Novilysobacter antarcticus TaxID=2862543 RepID=UPI001C994B35|nr:ferritin family protein [Lysobacter antarcticus]
MSRTLTDNESREPLALAQNTPDQRRVSPMEYARRRSLLRDDPDIDVVDMPTLVGIAKAIEDEAVRRYRFLAELMESRGETSTAAAFRVMLEEEQSHVQAVDRWATSVGQPDVSAEDFEWQLPADLSSSWDNVAGSALLTPYRAFALAVENEERAFSFYAYLAAHAENDEIRAEAEKLGGEELRHAALLRKWRRRAYHRERRPSRPETVEIDSVAMLRDALAQREAAIAAEHLALAPRLRRAGDAASADLLERAIPAGTAPAPIAAAPATTAPADTSDLPAKEDPRHLLVDAQRPLEAMADMLETVMATADGELFDEAAAAMARVVERISQISLRMRQP